MQGVSYYQLAVQYFVTDSADIFFRKNSKELVSVLAGGQQAFLFAMDVSQVRTAVDQLVEKRLASKRRRA